MDLLKLKTDKFGTIKEKLEILLLNNMSSFKNKDDILEFVKNIKISLLVKACTYMISSRYAEKDV